MNFIKWFDQISKFDTFIAGGKGASLGEMTKAGISMSDGFVILSNVFEKFLEETDLNVEIDSILHSVNIKEIHTIENASEKIRDLILKTKMPKDIGQEIKKEFKKLNAEFVAVRSSATAEDSSSATWAGQLDSFLNTTGKTLLKNVQKCWASLFTPRAIFYRFEKSLHNSKISVAVVVQKMVASEVSGITFSVHPVTQDHNQLIIEAGYGLGEAIVSGQITPDSYVIEKNPRRIIDKNISVQERGIYRKQKSGGNEWQNIPQEKGQQQKLTDEQILELSELILKIENHYGFPVDIEWAYENNKFYITQSRPITMLSLTNPTLTIAEKFIDALGEQELFPPLHNCSLFINGSKWNIKKYYDKHYSDRTPFPIMVIAKENEGIMFMQLTKTKRLAEEVFKLFWRSDSTLEERINKYKKQARIVDDFYNKIIVKNELERKSFSNLARQAKQMRDATYETNSIPYFSVYFDKEMCLRLLNEAGSKINTQRLNAIWKNGTIPAFESFEKRRERYLLELLEHRETWKEISIKCQYFEANYNKISSLKEIGEKLKKNYSRLEKIKDRNKFIVEEKVKKEKIISEHIKWLLTLSLEEKKLVKLLQTVMELRDARKDPLSKFFIVAFRIAQKLFKEIGLDEKLIYFCTFDEIIKGKNYLLKNRKFLEKRPKGCVILVYYGGSEEIEYGMFEETKNKLEEFFLSQQTKDKDAKVIKGQAGSFGKIKGTVRIIMNIAKESDKFNKGDILVTGMTRPEFISLIKKSSAIITDEGGITCHAAIVSRELGTPCVIGTKFATKVLHDGDLVEVDADKGVVRILEKTKK